MKSEIDEWKRKKVRGGQNEKQPNQFSYSRSKSPIHFKRGLTNKSKNFKTKNSNRVVLKIYGNCKTSAGLTAHLDYMTSKSEFSVDAFDCQISNKQDMLDARSFFIASNENFDNPKNKNRETFNMIFSLKDYDLANLSNNDYKKILVESVTDTVKKKYPDNYFVASLHTDTDNPHVHICLSAKDFNTNKRIHIRPFDIRDMKYEFSKELIEQKFNVFPEKDPKIITQQIEQFKTNDFELVDYGNAKYEFDENAPQSFFIKYRTNRDEEIVTIWGKGIEKAINESDAKIGDRVHLKKVGRINNVNQWSIDVIERNKEIKKTTAEQQMAKSNTTDCLIKTSVNEDNRQSFSNRLKYLDNFNKDFEEMGYYQNLKGSYIKPSIDVNDNIYKDAEVMQITEVTEKPYGDAIFKCNTLGNERNHIYLNAIDLHSYFEKLDKQEIEKLKLPDLIEKKLIEEKDYKNSDIQKDKTNDKGFEIDD